MNRECKEVIAFAARVVTILAVIEAMAAFLLLMFGQVLMALVQGVLLGLELWVFFRLLRSYESTMIEVLHHSDRLRELEETVKQLQAALPGAGDAKPKQRKPAKATPVRQTIKPAALEPLQDGFIQCPNPYCREIQLDNREKCWRCGETLAPQARPLDPP